MPKEITDFKLENYNNNFIKIYIQKIFIIII